MVELALPPDTNLPDDEVATTRRRSVPTRTATVAIAVSVVAFVVFFLSPVRMETDSYWVVFTARSLVAHGDVNLDEYHEIVEHGTGFQVERYQGHTYYEASLATSLAAVPFVAVASLLDGQGLDHRLAEGHALPLDGVIAAVIAALATALMFLVLTGLTTRRWIALLSTAAFAFGTQVWSTASRTTWMHTPSLLCLAVALLLAQRVARNGKGVLALGAVLGLAYFVRPTNVVPLVIFGIWIAFHGRHALAAVCIRCRQRVRDILRRELRVLRQGAPAVLPWIPPRSLAEDRRGAHRQPRESVARTLRLRTRRPRRRLWVHRQATRW